MHQGSPSRAGATAVVLPAPGGATSTALRAARAGAASSVRQDGVDGKARNCHPFGAAGPEQVLGRVADPDQAARISSSAEQVERSTAA